MQCPRQPDDFNWLRETCGTQPNHRLEACATEEKVTGW
jgi:hypothetical protein